MARTSRLDQDAALPQKVAELIHDGLTHTEVAAAVGEGTHKDTITRWRKDPRVQAHLTRLREERTNRITSKIDSRLSALIETPDELAKLSIKELIEIRRELLPPAAQRHIVHRGADESAALADLQRLLSERPDLAQALGLAPGEEDEDAPLALPPAPEEPEGSSVDPGNSLDDEITPEE